jgi:hypothetical protein
MSLTALCEIPHWPRALSQGLSMARGDLPPAYLSTLNRARTSLVRPRAAQSVERYGSWSPRTWGRWKRNTPSAVCTVPSSYPFRYPGAVGCRSERRRPRASAGSCSRAAWRTRSGDRQTQARNNSSLLWVAFWPANHWASSCAFCSLGVICLAIRGVPSSGWFRTSHTLTFPEKGLSSLHHFYRDYRTPPR